MSVILYSRDTVNGRPMHRQQLARDRHGSGDRLRCGGLGNAKAAIGIQVA
jgi:hypothetical protein